MVFPALLSLMHIIKTVEIITSLDQVIILRFKWVCNGKNCGGEGMSGVLEDYGGRDNAEEVSR